MKNCLIPSAWNIDTLFLLTLLGGLFISTGCGTPIDLSSPDPATIPPPSFPTGALLYLDSSYVNGSYSVPPSGCSTQWMDLSGNSRNGSLTSFTCSGASGWSGDGSPGNPFQLLFDSSGYVVTQLDVQPSAYPSMTWEIWVKPTRLNYVFHQQLMSDDDGGFDRSLLIKANSSTFSAFTGSSGTGIWSPVTADLNQWQNIVLVYTPSDILMYKNGTAYSRGSAFGGAGNTIKKLNIGANPSFGEKLQGSVALFAVYNRALSAAEISEHCKLYQDRFAGVTCN